MKYMGNSFCLLFTCYSLYEGPGFKLESRLKYLVSETDWLGGVGQERKEQIKAVKESWAIFHEYKWFESPILLVAYPFMSLFATDSISLMFFL